MISHGDLDSDANPTSDHLKNSSTMEGIAPMAFGFFTEYMVNQHQLKTLRKNSGVLVSEQNDLTEETETDAPNLFLKTNTCVNITTDVFDKCFAKVVKIDFRFCSHVSLVTMFFIEIIGFQWQPNAQPNCSKMIIKYGIDIMYLYHSWLVWQLMQLYRFIACLFPQYT